MTGELFHKTYPTSAAARRAWQHWSWLNELALPIQGLVIPHAYHDNTKLIMEHIDGRPVHIKDLTTVAGALGQLHHAAQHKIGQHRLDQPFTDPSGLTITDFVSPRRRALGTTPLPHHQTQTIYKDANIRNFILTKNGAVAVIDFDDLTLAPAGYDLAKLLVSAAMTHGNVACDYIDASLAAYNHALPVDPCDRLTFDQWADLHGRLTAPYLGRNGYQHHWDDFHPNRPPQT